LHPASRSTINLASPGPCQSITLPALCPAPFSCVLTGSPRKAMRKDSKASDKRKRKGRPPQQLQDPLAFPALLLVVLRIPSQGLRKMLKPVSVRINSASFGPCESITLTALIPALCSSVYTNTRDRAHTYTHARTHTCTNTHTHTRTQTHTHAYTGTPTHHHTRTHTHSPTRPHALTHTCFREQEYSGGTVRTYLPKFKSSPGIAIADVLA
jgi:hypothetical protein